MSNSKMSSWSKPRVAIGGIWHETNTFAADHTGYEDFASYQLARDCELISKYRSTNTELGGMIQALDQLDFEPIPTLFAAAVPSGLIEHQCFCQLVDELIERIQAALPLQGIALALHGAAVADGFYDADAHVLERVREVVGNDVPVVSTFDYHANLSARMVENASILIGYDTYPHTDMAARGAEAIKLLEQLISGEIRFHSAFRKLPLLTSPLKQQTDELPMSQVMQELRHCESNPDIACASVAMGFPYSDVAHLGASVVAYGYDSEQVNTAADSIAAHIWNSRHDFQEHTVSAEEGIRQAVDSPDFPVIIVEAADNIGGGSAGDGTGVLRELLKVKAAGSVIVVYDPEAVELAEKAGAGAKLSIPIGGKSDKHHGEPVNATVAVKSVSDGEFVHKGSYMTGYITSMGRTSLVESDGVQIVLTSKRTMPFDAEQLRCLGIEPDKQKIIVVKAAIAWKAAYGDIAKRVLVVDTPGVCAADLSRLNYRKRPIPLYPLEQDTHDSFQENP